MKKSIIDIFEARDLHLVPLGGRCALTCGCGGLDAAPVPTNTQSVSHLGNGTLAMKIDLTMLEALKGHSQFSGLRGR